MSSDDWPQRLSMRQDDLKREQMRTICLDLSYISVRFTIVLYCIALLCKSSDERTKNETIPAGYASGRTGFLCRKPAGIDHRSFGTWDWPLPESTPERAFIEVLIELTDEQDFRSVDKLFESAVSLRPKIVQSVLEASQSVKAKRLFCRYAERHRHAWFDHINMTTIDLGRGKRQIVVRGRLNSRYQITVPADMGNEDEGTSC